MKKVYVLAAITALAIAAPTVASAQSTAKDTTSKSVSSHKDGEWRAAKLVGVDVYNNANEKIGDIEDIILDKSGKVAHVILGVGGFLGVGEHYVAVGYDQLKWVNEAVKTSSTEPKTTTEKTTTGATTTTTTTTRPVRAANENWYPDHVVFNATKDQLKAMPEFKY